MSHNNGQLRLCEHCLLEQLLETCFDETTKNQLRQLVDEPNASINIVTTTDEETGEVTHDVYVRSFAIVKDL